MFKGIKEKKKNIAVIGLGYVGLPLALEFAKKYRVIGFDINEERVAMMKNGIDPSKELEGSAFDNTDILFTTDADDLKQAHFYIVAVPTPIDASKSPDLGPVLGASSTVGKVLKKGDYVVYESTVYPGCTEEDCVPILEKKSGLKMGVDFKLGYSPERINPGDKVRTLTNIIKIVSGNDASSLKEISALYGSIIKPGIHEAESIKIAEAAKIIENTQRDINIALMNELSIIFDKMNIDTNAVLKAAGTKWNFLKFFPGMVGGHCIGVDPYYLTYKAKKLGYDPQVILSGRRINDNMPAFVAKRLTQFLIKNGKNPKDCKVLVMGITFKENVADIRNSKIADLINELKGYSINIELFDHFASHEEVMEAYNIPMIKEIGSDYDAIIVAVSHEEFKLYNKEMFTSLMKESPILFDLKSMYSSLRDTEGLAYWSL